MGNAATFRILPCKVYPYRLSHFRLPVGMQICRSVVRMVNLQGDMP